MKEFLSQRNIAFDEKDVSKDRDALEEMVRISGKMAVPIIVVGDEVIVGFNRARLTKILEEG